MASKSGPVAAQRFVELIAPRETPGVPLIGSGLSL